MMVALALLAVLASWVELASLAVWVEPFEVELHKKDVLLVVVVAVQE